MKYSAVALAALVAGAAAHYDNGTVVYTTETVSEIETVCPGPTTFTHGTVTYTYTETVPGTVTITNCPCVVTKPVYSSSVVQCYDCAPQPTLPPSTPGPYPNATAPAPSQPPVASTPSAAPPAGSSPPVSPPIATGAASKAFAASGAGLAGAFGILAYLL